MRLKLRGRGRRSPHPPGDVLTQGATEEFNLLEAKFEAAGSEIEKVVLREEITELFQSGH
ncbi:hypothetical protein DER30_4640 [Streptomyces sp. HB202]|nr:hypothetical protein DER30_4640 [Streptomyces sp. HB202]